MKEQQIQSKIIKYLDSIGAYVVKVIQASKAGVPDLLVCYKGEFFGLEVKKPDTIHKVTELQKTNLTKIRKAGGKSYVVSSVDDVIKILN